MQMRETGVREAAWVFILSLTTIPILLVDGNYATALPIIKAEWNLTNEEAGSIYSAFYFGFVVGSAILATATDYYSARTIFLISGVWLVLANLLAAPSADRSIFDRRTSFLPGNHREPRCPKNPVER